MDLELEISEGFDADMARIYEEAFPPEESRASDYYLTGNPALRIYKISIDGNTGGLLTAWYFDRFRYIEHFAIDPGLRGRGIGSRVLRAFLAEVDTPVILEVERPEKGLYALRRIDFYKRNGFATLDNFNYIQPPYSSELPAVPLLLMSTDPAIDAEKAAATLYENVYGVEPGIF